MEILSLVTLFLYLGFLLIPLSKGHPICSSHDSLALLHFNKSLSVADTIPDYHDYHYICDSSFPVKTMSWNRSADCCTWDGVTCDNFTGRVIGLDLSCSKLEGTIHPNSSLFQLRHLQTLDLSFNNFSSSPIPDAFSNLQELTVLGLNQNNFIGPFPSFLVNNLTKLEYLNFWSNSLTGPLPLTANGLENLKELYLSGNSLNGSIPSWMFSLPCLIHLWLDSNHLSGPLPELKSKSLESLVLSDNKLSGPIPQFLGDLVNLTLLSLVANNLSGDVGAQMFSSMTNLQSLELSHSGLSWSSSEDNINITYPHLYRLGLASCGVKIFPDFLLNSKELKILDLSENEIQGMFPIWFGNFSSLLVLNLSHNNLTSLDYLPWESMREVHLQSNSLTGPLPPSLCEPNKLHLLDLSYNNLSAEIPDCLFISESLSVLDFQGNNFHGPIPDIFPAHSGLYHIGLSDNQLEGPIPRSLANCTSLRALDLGNNEINDTFPTWLEMLQELKVLILKSNRFYGPIVVHQTKFPFQNLTIFDISGNSFIGSLPTKLLKGMMNMSTKDSKLEYMEVEYISGIRIWKYEESALLMIKNREVEFQKISKFFTTVDLSRNKFEGEIPKFIGNLNSLRLLNLSHNFLTGNIPAEMKNMSNLEALDLSNNQLTGEIPKQLTSLTFLGVLNVSHNHLVGPIPRGNQFNTFPNDSYFGNRDLCGFPLSNECGNKGTSPVPLVEQEDESSLFSEITWSSVLIGYGCGFIFGFTILYLVRR